MSDVVANIGWFFAGAVFMLWLMAIVSANWRR